MARNKRYGRFTRDPRGSRYEIVGLTTDRRRVGVICRLKATGKVLLATYAYGECHACGEQLVTRRVKQDFWVKGKLFVVEDVPAGMCPQCGEKVVRAEVGRRIAALIEKSRSQQKVRKISVPVFSFARKTA